MCNWNEVQEIAQEASQLAEVIVDLRFKVGDRVVFNRNVSFGESFQAPSPALGGSETPSDTLALGNMARISELLDAIRGPVFKKGQVGVITARVPDGATPYKVEVAGHPAAAFAPEDALSLFEGVDDSVEYPKGFVVGALVRAKRDVTYADVYQSRISPQSYEIGLRLLVALDRPLLIFGAGTLGVIDELRPDVEIGLMVVVNEISKSGTPVPFDWFELA